MKQRWLPGARCHFEKKHESHIERGDLWRCKWCESMLKEFEIFGRVPEEDAYWGRQKSSGLTWKIKGNESMGRWDSKAALKRGMRWG